MAIPLSAVIAAVFLQTLWGGNTVAIKLGLEAFPPLWSAFFRFLIGAACILIYARIRGIRLLPESGEWAGILWGSVFFIAQIAAMNIGISMTTGMNAAVLMATFPLFASVTSHFIIANDRLSLAKSGGLCVAFAGVAVVLTDGRMPDMATWGWGNLVTLLGAALLGSRQVFNATLVRRIDPVRVIYWQMILSLPVFALSGALLETIAWEQIGWVPLAGIAYQGIVIAGFGFLIVAYFLKLYSPSVMLSFGFISPVSGVALSALLLSETLTWPLGAGMIAVAAGLVIITRSGGGKPG